MAGSDEDLFIPPAACDWLIERLFEVGPIAAVGMGVGPISFTEIEAYQRQTGFDLTGWPSRLLRRMSISYAAESDRAQAPDCPPPWVAENVEERRADARSLVDRQLDSLFGDEG